MHQLLSEGVPRYTSYPSIPFWEKVGSDFVVKCLADHGHKESSYGIYVHIPFCHQRCYFCGCIAMASRNLEQRRAYLSALQKEIELKASYLGHCPKAGHLHFGGGTPTILSKEEMAALMETLWEYFDWESSSEIAIEVDPRTMHAKEDLLHLASLGFNRVSLGVQDLDEQVQKLIGRHQTKKQTFAIYDWCREVGFQGINLDLIYGLPGQTLPSFHSTIDKIIEISPDRISLFSFACLPQKNPNQKGISQDALPTPQEKLAFFLQAKSQLVLAGYIPIGMDHFARPDDELALAYKRRTLRRNFQGYHQGKHPNLIGLGLSAISDMSSNYFQNTKNMMSYLQQIHQNNLPVEKGKKLSKEDQIRGWVIEKILCFFEVDKGDFYRKFGLDFDLYFQNEILYLESRFSEEQLSNHGSFLSLKGDLQFFARNVASYFDPYLKEKSAKQFSSAV